MADYTQILYEKQRNGVLITLNRPEAMNAISGTLQEELHAALDAAVADPEIRAIVLTGAGSAFSSGMDQGGGGGRGETVWPYGITEGMSAAEFIDSRRGSGRNDLAAPVGAGQAGHRRHQRLGNGRRLLVRPLHPHNHRIGERRFAQPEVRHGSNTSFMWTLMAGFKNALRYGLTGDHIDAQEALRIGIVNKVVPHDQLLDECFHIVERIALVPPETVKINLAIATMGLEMMGLRDAVFLDSQLSASARSMMQEEYRRPLDETRKNEGVGAYLRLRDDKFRPEPFGPRSRARE